MNEAEIKNFVPSRISEELRPYVRLSKVEFTSNSDGICNLLFSHNGRSDRYDTVCYQRIPQDFPIEITRLKVDMERYLYPIQIESNDFYRFTSRIRRGQWIVTMETKNHLFTAEIERLVPSRITEDLRRCLRLTGVGISDISSEFVVLF